MTGRHEREAQGYVAEGRKRLLITGSRLWPNEATIAGAILAEWVRWGRPPMTLVHGGAKGADLMAAGIINTQIMAREGMGALQMFKVEEYPANWDLHGRAAGHIRNAEMMALGADLCLAFIFNNSRGASGCVALAEKANIPVVLHRIDDPRGPVS